MGFLDFFRKANPAELLKNGDVQGLITALRSRTPKTRCLAAAALGEIKGDRAADALARALEDDDPRVRLFVAGNLAKIGGPIALGGLRAYKRKYCANCAKPLQSGANISPLPRGFGFEQAVQHAAQLLSTTGRECRCGATICAGCLPVSGGQVTCGLCGASV